MNPMKMPARLIATAALVCAAPVVAHAQFAKPEDAIKYRKAAFTVMASHFGRNAPVVRGERPFNAQDAATNASIVEMLSTLPFTAFGPGTDKGDTKAKPEVWSDATRFNAAKDTMLKAVAEFAVAARSGNEAAFKMTFGAVGKACKGCHDDFRKE
jgi:cytochrome c556